MYGPDVDVAAASSAHDDAALHAVSSESVDAGTSAQEREVRALFARLQQQQQLTVLEPASRDSASLPRVWLFVVNNGSQDFPAADALGELIEVDSGAWTRASEQALDAALQQRLFRALHALLTRHVLRRHSDIAHSSGRFELRDAAFVYRAPSLSQLNHFDVYLDEALPTSAFELHVQLLTPSYVLCVAVSVTVTDASLPLHGDELGDPEASWRRLLGLPSRRDHSLVDVWHLDDSLVPRIIAETKYKDVHPRFVAVAKRTRKSDGDDAADGDDTKKGDEHDDDDGDDDDESARHDGDGGNDTGDELVRRAAPGKKKRKKTNTDAVENDESVTPVSPDTHVNTPDAPGPTVRVTFPHDTVAGVHVDASVSHFKRRRPKHTTKSGAASGDLAMIFSAATNGTTTARSQALKPDPSVPVQLPVAAASRRFSVTDYANLVKAGATTPTHALLHARRGSLLGSAPPAAAATPRADVKPTLSVAVSLVASLSHDEQQEALDGRPTKTHPLLEALEDFVAGELQRDVDTRARRVVPSKQPALPRADAYVPRSRRASALLSVNAAVAERVRNRLLADRFAPWTSPYAPHPGAKVSKQAKRERQRRVVLAFDDAKLAAYAQQMRQEQTEVFATRDCEIALGVHLAASDALVAWRPAAGAASRWTTPQTPGTRVATPQEKHDVVERLEPHLMGLRSFLTRGGGGGSTSGAPWLPFADFAKHSSADNTETASRIAPPPQFSVATADFRVNVAPAVVSEYLLRGFHPIAAPKPVDYAIVCPHSPSEWLGVLALSYLTCFRSKYAQCHMGDHAPIDLATVAPTGTVSVDASNALLLLQCASSMKDAFGPYRAAGALLQPVLRQGVKKTQAFSRSAVANVIYLVVPCARHDVKHRAWALGAFARGLFGADDGAALEDVAWRGSVTIELLFLDELYDVGVNPNPFVLMPRCFGLYDRVSESVGLKPADVESGAAAPAPGGKMRFVSERLYHLAERGDAAVPHVYAGYAVSADGNWVVCSCVDAVGSVLETHMIRLSDGALDDAIVAMMAKWLPFLALFGDRARLVVARVYDSDDSDDVVERELQAWRHVSATRADAFLPQAFAPLVASVALVHVRFLSPSHVQLRDANVSMLSSAARSGLLAIAPRDRADAGSRRACYARGGGWNLATSCFARASSRGADAAVLRVSVALDDVVPAAEELAAADVERILSDFHALSYLTMHPISMERASPLPLHLAAIDALQQDVRVLTQQLRTDPLALR